MGQLWRICATAVSTKTQTGGGFDERKGAKKHYRRTRTAVDLAPTEEDHGHRHENKEDRSHQDRQLMAKREAVSSQP